MKFISKIFNKHKIIFKQLFWKEIITLSGWIKNESLFTTRHIIYRDVMVNIGEKWLIGTPKVPSRGIPELLRLPHSSITNAALDKRYLNQRIMMSRPRQKPNKNSQKIFRPRNFQKTSKIGSNFEPGQK